MRPNFSSSLATDPFYGGRVRTSKPAPPTTLLGWDSSRAWVSAKYYSPLSILTRWEGYTHNSYSGCGRRNGQVLEGAG